MDVANLGHEDGIPSSLIHCGDYFFHSCLNTCKIEIKHTIDPTFQDCLALTFCDFIDNELNSGMGLSHIPGWDNIWPDVKFGRYIPVSRVTKNSLGDMVRKGPFDPV